MVCKEIKANNFNRIIIFKIIKNKLINKVIVNNTNTPVGK